MVKTIEEIRTYRNKRSHKTRTFLKDLDDVNVFTKVPRKKTSDMHRVRTGTELVKDAVKVSRVSI